MTLEPPKKVVQTWALSHPDWPESTSSFLFGNVRSTHDALTDHTATLTSRFAQSADSTKLTLSLEGVPVGLQDETKQNIEGY